MRDKKKARKKKKEGKKGRSLSRWPVALFGLAPLAGKKKEKPRGDGRTQVKKTRKKKEEKRLSTSFLSQRPTSNREKEKKRNSHAVRDFKLRRET